MKRISNSMTTFFFIIALVSFWREMGGSIGARTLLSKRKLTASATSIRPALRSNFNPRPLLTHQMRSLSIAYQDQSKKTPSYGAGIGAIAGASAMGGVTFSTGEPKFIIPALLFGAFG